MTDKEWLLENGFCDLGYEDNRIILQALIQFKNVDKEDICIDKRKRYLERVYR